MKPYIAPVLNIEKIVPNTNISSYQYCVSCDTNYSQAPAGQYETNAPSIMGEEAVNRHYTDGTYYYLCLDES